MSSRMQIGELASRAGVSHRTIHYYERIGLMKPAERVGVGYRYYDETAYQRLEKISALKRLGLSLDEIAAVIDLYYEDAGGIKGKEKVLNILEAFRCDLENNIARMKSLLEQARQIG